MINGLIVYMSVRLSVCLSVIISLKLREVSLPCSALYNENEFKKFHFQGQRGQIDLVRNVWMNIDRAERVNDKNLKKNAAKKTC